MKIEDTRIYNFAKRLGYSLNSNLPDNIIVDHVNKEYNAKAFKYDILFDIIFWNTPPFVYNVVKSSLKHTFGYNMTVSNIVYAINKLDLEIIPTKYRYTNLYNLLHPCVDTSLRTDFKKVIDIILCRVFDEEDSYFNIYIDKPSLYFKYNDIFKKFAIASESKNLILSGSNALSHFGRVYRDKIKDFDFVIDNSYLPKEICNIINENIMYNKIIGKDRIKIENRIKDIFRNSNFYKELSTIFDNSLNILHTEIDRTSNYNNIKVVFTFSYKDIEIDLIFKPNVKYETFVISIFNESNKCVCESKFKIEDINDIIYAKKLLGRYKDFQDLINFKPYTRLNNNGKCVIDYEK